MAKTITWTAPYATPVVTPSLQAGGTLTLGTTYYYRVVALKVDSSYGWGREQAESPASVEVSATPAGANQTIRLTWPQVAGAAYYDIYRTTTSGNYGTSTRIDASVIDGGAGGTTYDDDGSETFIRTNCAIFAVSTLPMGFVTTIGRGHLLISGGSAVDPITLDDIVTAIGDTNFCKMQDEKIFGLLGYWYNTDITAETHFADSYKELRLIGQHRWNFTHEDSSFQLGLYDSDNDCGYSGCSIYSHHQYNSSADYSNAVKLYKCHIFNGNYINRQASAIDPLSGPTFSGDVILKDCDVQGRGMRITGSPTIIDLIIDEGTLFPVNGYFTNCENITVKRSYLYNYYQHITYFKGYKVYNETSYDMQFRSSSTDKYGIFVNPYFHGRTDNIPVIYWHSNLDSGDDYIDIYYTIDLTVLDSDGSAISGATVQVTDTDDSLVVDTTTDVDGQITTQEVKAMRYTHTAASGNGFGDAYTDTDDRGPFTLTVSKASYDTYSQIFTLTEAIDWTLSMSDIPALSENQLAVSITSDQPAVSVSVSQPGVSVSL